MPANRSTARAAGRLGAIAGVLALAGSLAVPAGAASGGGAYAAASRADGVLFRVEGNQISVASATADADSGPTAAATGVGFFTPEHTEAATSAEVTEDGQQAGSAEETCANESPPEFPLGFAEGPCSSAVAAIQGGHPSATGTARGGTISMSVAQLPIGDTPLGDAVDEIIDGLGPILDPIEEGGLDAETLFRELLDAILGGAVVNIDSGVATADVTESEDGTVTAIGSIEGSVIGLFDRGEALGGPMVTITVGAASASVTRNAAGDQPVPAFHPASATITIAPDVLELLPPDFPGEIAVPAGQSQCIPLPDPLESCITAGGGTTETTEESVTAKAAGVRIDLLNGLPEGGITLALSNAEAGIALPAPAPPTSSPPPTSPPATTPPTLPRTGGPGPWLPVAGWALLGAAALTGGVVRLAAGRQDA